VLQHRGGDQRIADRALPHFCREPHQRQEAAVFEGQEEHEPAIGFETAGWLLEVLLSLADAISLAYFPSVTSPVAFSAAATTSSNGLDMLDLELISRVGLHVSTSCEFRLGPGREFVWGLT
jgi:hypothetical protein